jgi:hypothetical protein
MFLLFLALAFWNPQEKPLPDTKSFLTEFRKTLRGNNALLSQYTYTEKETEITLDSKRQPKKTETNVYQVIHALEEWKSYRRQIVKDGVPLTEQELAKQDQKETERVAKETRKRTGSSETKRQQEKAKADREEQQILDDLFALYDFQLIRREVLQGTTTIFVKFKPKPQYKPKTREGKIFQHIAGQSWVSEEDHELVKLEAEVIDAISIGAGLLAKLQKGSTVSVERRKVHDEIWLPFKEEAFINGKILLLKGLNIHAITEYSDHKKYSVETQMKFGDVAGQP